MHGVTQLGYLGIGVSDVAAWERFATETLGLQLGDKGDDGTLLLRLDDYHHRFLIHPDGQDDVAYFGWEVADAHALREVEERLRTAGIEVRRGTDAEVVARRVVELVKYEDPSGIASEIFYGPLMAFQQPFRSPRPLSGFVSGEQGLGHMVVSMDDLEQSVTFYRDVLGMRISDYVTVTRPGGEQLRLAFFHCNPRHHTIAFYGRPDPPKRLNHFMLQVRSMDDVGTTYDLCQQTGVPVTRSLGRHTNDHMVSFYMRSPSGFEVEYGWGARVVDDATWQVQLHTTGSIWGHRYVQP